MLANIRISGAQTFPLSESDVRLNFGDPNRIIAAANSIVAGGGTQGQFSSSDGGATWKQSNLSLNAGDAFQSDPCVDWTSEGTAWAITIGVDSAQTNLQLRCFKSIDGGATWTFDANASGLQTNTDKEMMWVDHSTSSPYKDNIYVTWHNGAPVFVNRRTGPAGSWQTPLQVSGAETTGTGIGGDIKTNAYGDVFVFWPDTGSRKLFVAKSTDGGATFGTPIRIATTFDSFDIGLPAFNSRRALIYVTAGAYRTATKNLVYAAWVDQTGATGCNSAANEPGANVTSSCKTRIWFARSTDGGATWGTASMINNQTSTNDQFNPKLAVDETTGNLGVIYYDTLRDTGRLRTDVWMQISEDDGVTWQPAFRVTELETDETIAGADTGNQYGDYNGLSAHAGTFVACWTDRRGGATEEIWAARLVLFADGAHEIAVAPLSDQRLEVWATDGHGGLFTTWKLATDPDANWSGWPDFLAEVGPIAAGVRDVAVAPLSDGRLELWVGDGDGGLWTTWKLTTDPNANWSGWSDFLAEVGPIAAGVRDVAVAPLSDGRLELWVGDGDGGLWTTWKLTTDPNANWSGWSDFLGEI
jgi:hypothetical protein